MTREPLPGEYVLDQAELRIGRVLRISHAAGMAKLAFPGPSIAWVPLEDCRLISIEEHRRLLEQG